MYTSILNFVVSLLIVIYLVVLSRDPSIPVAYTLLCLLLFGIELTLRQQISSHKK